VRRVRARDESPDRRRRRLCFGGQRKREDVSAKFWSL